MGKILRFFQQSKHYGIEMFGVGFSVLSLCMILVVYGCFKSYLKSTDTTFNDKVMYTQSFTTSRTNISGDVVNVFVDDDKTKAFVLLKFRDTKNISLSASAYQAFLTCADVEKNPQYMTSTPAGGFYMFGSTGYMGVYIVNKKGFTLEILDLVVRCNEELLSSQSDLNYSDGSFEDFDQFRIYFNPGARLAKTLDCLNSEEPPTIYDLYQQAVLLPSEKEVREELSSDLEDMRVSLVRMAEYKERLRRDGVVVADAPYLIDGDKIVSYYYDMETPDTPDSANEDVPYKLVPNTVIAGGYDFDWYAGSVGQGYLDDLIGDSGLSYNQFFSAKRKEFNAIDYNTKNIVWFMADGTPVADLNKGYDEAGEYASINNDISLLTDEWNTFYQLKAKYQTEDLRKLLLLEVAAKNVQNNSSMNFAENIIFVY